MTKTKTKTTWARAEEVAEILGVTSRSVRRWRKNWGAAAEAYSGRVKLLSPRTGENPSGGPLPLLVHLPSLLAIQNDNAAWSALRSTSGVRCPACGRGGGDE
ncbi:MAG: hypothetical protein JSV86_05555 [Gemmatimonadota bacterium]|nr:MAG: hypothetical protein JSV86_05555 [Gemmatimonadota bacterium]